MELHYFPRSHWSRAVNLVLREKGVEVVARFVDITRNASFEPAYMALNPRGVVPTLVHDGTAVCNSPTIVRYLDDVVGPTVWPDDPVVNHWAAVLEDFPLMHLSYRIWVLGRHGERSAEILRDKVDRAGRYAVAHPEHAALYERKQRFFQAFSDELVDPDARSRLEASSRDILDQLRHVVAGQDFIGDDTWTWPDAIATSILFRLIDLALIDEWNTAGDPLHAYFQRLSSRPSYQWVWTEDPLLS